MILSRFPLLLIRGLLVFAKSDFTLPSGSSFRISAKFRNDTTGALNAIDVPNRKTN